LKKSEGHFFKEAQAAPLHWSTSKILPPQKINLPDYCSISDKLKARNKVAQGEALARTDARSDHAVLDFLVLFYQEKSTETRSCF
jgi:hypothetical protein